MMRSSISFNAAIERGFVKQGTSITTRLLVLDKVETGDEPVLTASTSFPELAAMIDALAARSATEAVPPPASLPVRSPFKLVTTAQRPLPTPAKRITPPVVVEPLTYASLETAAPLAEQVGHYLPYRPSRVVIEQADDHPTPLVESVAMGSIAAPIPTAIPQLPGGLIAKGVLSAAQAETLIYAANAHARDLPGRFEPEDRGCVLKASAEGQSYRQGYFLGDGTGAGKGRQVASVILDRLRREPHYPARSPIEEGTKSMNNADLAEKLAEANGLTKADARKLVDGVFAAIADAAASGDEISLNGFGKFKVKASAEREGRNPSTGATIKIAASKKLTFAPAKAVKDRLNG